MAINCSLTPSGLAHDSPKKLPYFDKPGLMTVQTVFSEGKKASAHSVLPADDPKKR